MSFDVTVKEENMVIIKVKHNFSFIKDYCT